MSNYVFYETLYLLLHSSLPSNYRDSFSTLTYQPSRHILLCEFVKVPLKFIDLQLKESGNLYPAYRTIEGIERTYDEIAIPPYQRLAKPRKSRSNMPEIESLGYGLPELQKELLAARKRREKEEGKVHATQGYLCHSYSKHHIRLQC